MGIDNNKELLAKIDRHGMRYEYDERVAILEVDGGLTCDDARLRALKEICIRIDQFCERPTSHQDRLGCEPL